MAKVIAHIKEVPFLIEIKSPTGNTIIADEPVEKGGKDTGFSPKELLTASLSACTSATLRMYIDKKGWIIPEIKVETELIEMEGKTLFSRKLEFAATVDEDKKKRLILVASACPVHKILSGTIEIETELV